MASRSPNHSFNKREREKKKKEKAARKMLRRQERKGNAPDAPDPDAPDAVKSEVDEDGTLVSPADPHSKTSGDDVSERET